MTKRSYPWNSYNRSDGYFSSSSAAPVVKVQQFAKKVGDIHFSQDSMSGRFKNGSSIDSLKAEFLRKGSDPDQVLTPNFIEVVFYRSKWYSMDNRRLWCLKQSYPADMLVQVYAFKNEKDYNQVYGDKRWEMKYSTICAGEYIFIEPRGHLWSIASKWGPDVAVRHCKIKCSVTDSQHVSIKREVTRMRLDYRLKDVQFRDDYCIILGAKRDVDMAGAIIYDRFYRNFKGKPTRQLLVSENEDLFGAYVPLAKTMGRHIGGLFSELGAPESETIRPSQRGDNVKRIGHICYRNAIRHVLIYTFFELKEDECPHDVLSWVDEIADGVHMTLICAVNGLDGVDSWMGWSKVKRVDFMVSVAWEYLDQKLQDVLQCFQKEKMSPEQRNSKRSRQAKQREGDPAMTYWLLELIAEKHASVRRETGSVIYVHRTERQK
eukprot:TRINITY_DN16237_c0_g2_i1.p1 TRINITY_DN16237_c0_g2~~TRINITY_DN16237_c0_g2_i1.p1  ORF type:complete len:433 (-),score=48.16 TRINITY_DN16237_c0_g2_i1:26-1324(-)